MDTYASLLIAYLERDFGAIDVLNDYLEDNGLERTVVDGSRAARLALVLDRMLPTELAQQLACDFAEHAIKVVARRNFSVANILDVIQKKRLFLEGKLNRVELEASTEGVFSDAYQKLGFPEWRAAWSAWATVFARASNAARAAQEVAEAEIEWQIDRTIERIRSVDQLPVTIDE